jgi:hypothetical protein
MDFLVVLFKNKEKKKIINKFKTEKRAISFFKKKIEESKSVIFNKETENGNPCSYELCLLKRKSKSTSPIYIKDEIGRQIKVELDSDDYEIYKVEKYRIEELFLDYDKNKKISSQEFIKKYLNKSGIKMISKLNNKIVLQNEDKIKLFTFKTCDDSERFIDSLVTKFNSEGKKDCIFVKDYSTIHRKYLYKILTDGGFPIDYLQRYSTTFPSKK